MPGAPDPLPAPLDTAPFSVAEAAAAGLSPSRLRASDLRSPFVGVRTTASPSTPLELAKAYLPKMSAGEFFSHTTAALIHGMWLPLALERQMRVHVSVVKPQRAPRDRRVAGHHLVDRPVLVQRLGGVALSSPWETWGQLARLLSVDALVVAGDALLAKGRANPSLMLERLWDVATDADRPFHAKLLEAAGKLRIGVRSAAETGFRLFVVASGLPEPEVNLEIRNEAGEFVAEGDLACTEHLVLIEYEGDGHRDRKQFRKDIHRIERIQEVRWRVIRVTRDDEVERPEETIERIRKALRERGWPG